MLITLITKDKINSITLPDKISGQYWLSDFHLDSGKKLLSIEGVNEEWKLKSGKDVKVIDEKGNTIKSISLHLKNMYEVCFRTSNEKAIVLVEPITENRQMFTKFSIVRDSIITIGRNEKNDIILSNKFVSGLHAELSFKEGKWHISDHNSVNGTFVNGLRKKDTDLAFGDTIYIMGFKVIIGKSFIAMNNPDESMQLNTENIKLFVKQTIELQSDDEEYELPVKDYFYRSPRFKRDIETEVFRIDSPPNNAVGEEMPMILVMGPAVTMGMASMTTALFAVTNAIANGNMNAAIPSVVMSVSMLLGTILWPLASKSYDKNKKHKKEALRQEKYRDYLKKVEQELSEECRKQEDILRENFVPVADCVNRIKNVKRNLWEREFSQNDFLKLRVGAGDGLLNAEITYNPRKFSVDDDNLQEELYHLCEQPKVLKDIPITFSLFDNYISGVIGMGKKVTEFAKGFIFQLASFYSYDEVKLVFIYDESMEEYEFVKWLPHVWSNDKKFRFIATNQNELKEVSAYIEREIENRSDMNEKELEDVSPYFVIFAMSKKLADRAEMIKKISMQKKNLHFSVIAFYDELKNLPKECTMVIELKKERAKLFDRKDVSGKAINFIPDIFIKEEPEELSIRLSNILLDETKNSLGLPQVLTFLEMFGVGKVEHLNVLTRWKNNDPTKSLQAEVGVDTLGELFKLDLHEKFHGPHGLVAGMTGSGKSEFIISYILSLAVNYHPNEVAFILIDYKGGGMAKSFEHLPHTAGIITNLDGSAIKRSLVSIESELKRRQAIFSEAGKQVGVSNIDIYKYQKLYREAKVNEPLQHLFIISDEFAELKTQQPDFMTQLVSAARIGRSLGVHLILATQKPSGVVDDQIWSNSKFRVCLKVQERSDSMDMLKRPDAAELTDTGRFYLQVGYNELFEIGQSAWAGAPYYPSDKVITEKDNSVVVIDKNGRPIKQGKIDKLKSLFPDAKKQLDMITEHLSIVAKEENINIKKLWLEPIPGMIFWDKLREKYNVKKEQEFKLNPIIGEYDDPARQRQCLLTLPISEEGNTAVYGVSGSGKTTFLTTMVFALIREYTPLEVNVYLLDFASETLRAFSKAPHVGDVILAHESEKVNNLFKMLYSEIQRRKKLFADYGGDYHSYISAGEVLASVVVAINNFTAFTELYEDKEEAVAFLTREGTKYGIYFVLTASSPNAIRFRLAQNFKQLLVLQLNDVSDYSTVLGKTDGLYPAGLKGRGLIKKDAVYEFQIAHVTEESVPFQFIQKVCKEAQEGWVKDGAPKVPILPKQVNMEFLSDYIHAEKDMLIPVGVETQSLNVYQYPFGNSYINLISSSGNDYQAFFYELSAFLSAKCRLDVTVIDAPQTFRDKEKGKFSYYAAPGECETVINELFELVLYRNNTYKEALEQNKDVPEFERKVIIINSIAALKDSLSDVLKQKLSLLLEKGDVRYHITILYGEPVKNISNVSFEKWYKNHRSDGEGIWIGNGFTEQYQLKPGKITSDMRTEIGNGFGYALQKGKCLKIKLLSSGTEEEADDE